MATTGGEPLLLDTSVLLEASNRARKHHRAALRVLETHPDLVFPAQVAREFLVVATRPPEVNGLGLESTQALESLNGFRARVRLLPEERPLLPTLIKLVQEHRLTGKRIHDANLVAAAIVHKIPEILTINLADFRSFTRHVRCRAPG